MKPHGITAAQQREWMKQWRGAETALADAKREELRAMTDDDARAAAARLFDGMSFPPLAPDREKTSGLVEQQRFFQLARC